MALVCGASATCLRSEKFFSNQNFVIFLFLELVALLAVTTLYMLLRFIQFVVYPSTDEYELDSGATYTCSGRMQMTLYFC